MRRRPLKLRIVVLGGSFNSRLREEATFSIDFGDLDLGCFNSRLREEATQVEAAKPVVEGFQLTPP